MSGVERREIRGARGIKDSDSVMGFGWLASSEDLLPPFGCRVELVRFTAGMMDGVGDVELGALDRSGGICVSLNVLL
jgi:hypothetical protein